MKRIWRNKEGVSPVIATILMVAITVVLAAVLYVMVSGYMTGGGGTPLSGQLTYRTADSTPNTGMAKAEISVTAPSNALLTDWGVTVTDSTGASSGKLTFSAGANGLATAAIGTNTFWVNVTHLVSDNTHVQGGDRITLTARVTAGGPVSIKNWEVIMSATGYSGTMSLKVPA